MKLKLSLLIVLSILVFAGCSENNSSSGEVEGGANVDYPNDTIEFLIPYPAGGGTDLVGRILTKYLEKHMPNETSIVIENESGGGGVVGLTNFLKADPDGHQMVMTPSSVLTLQTHFEDTPFELDSFEPVLNVSTVRQTLLVQEDAPWKTFDDWLEYVEENPGEVDIATSGVGSTQHIALEMLNEALNINTKHVPYDGAGEVKTALMGGHVDGAVSPFHAEDQGSLRPLVSFSGEQNDALEDVPLLKDMGTDIEIDVLHGIYVPKETPEEIKTIIHDALRDTMEDPEFIEEFTKTQVDLNYINAVDYKELLQSLYDEIGATMERVGIIE